MVRVSFAGGTLTRKSWRPFRSALDNFIAGWTKYWNEVIQPQIQLDPKFVKDLIASEASFDPNILANPKDSNSARGLMQLTNSTRKILADEKGELKDWLHTGICG